MIAAIQIVTTAGSREEAGRIAQELVSRELAACVQVSGPISSTYRWNGEIETSEEWLCVAKTRRTLYAAVESTIRELHSYDVPEILAFHVIEGNADYMAWLAGALRQAGDEPDDPSP